jgi:cell wall-associated NlpC family hydrolase
MRIVKPLTDAERVRFIAAARHMVGTKFGHRGRSVRKVDCIGLVAMALSMVGRAINDRNHYGRNPVRDGLLDVCREHFGDPVPDMNAGDVVAMSWREEAGKPLVNHVGIIFDYPLGDFAMVHAFKEKESVIAHRIDETWAARIDAVFRP